MCGIFGFASSKPIKRIQQAMMQLAIYNEERGKQSWGVTDGTKIVKDIGPIGRNLWHIPWPESGSFVGHTRAATAGDIKKENAHPFLFKREDGSNVIGVHNGVLSNWKELNDKYKVKLEVDSMHIFRNIALGMDLKDIQGYGTIVFFKDVAEGRRLFFSRFNGGQLSIAQVRKNGGIVWSSEEFALDKALDGANIDHFMYKVKEGRIYYFEDNQLFDSKEDLDVGSNVRKYYGNAHRSFHDSLDDDRNFMGCGMPNGNFRSRASNVGLPDSIKTQRTVRLRIHRAPDKDDPSMTPEDRVLEAIKEIIFNDVNVSTISSISHACVVCKKETTRRLLGKEDMCLPDIAKEIYAGRVVVSGVDVEKLKLEHAPNIAPVGAC